MIERYVLEALQRAVTLAATPTPVKYVGRNAPTNSGKWWEIVYIPNNINNEFWSEGKTYRGIMRLILHWPQDNTGVYAAMDEVKRVADTFVKGDQYADLGGNVLVRITDHPDITSVIEESPEMLIPVTIRYSYLKV